MPKKIDKACFGHDMPHGDFKDFHRMFKGLPEEAFNFDKNMEYDGYQRSFVWMVEQTFDKKYTLLLKAIFGLQAYIFN